MKYFKTKGERIYLAISIAFIFIVDSMAFFNNPNKLQFVDIQIIIVATIFPFVPYTMYKLIFKKEENKSNTN